MKAQPLPRPAEDFPLAGIPALFAAARPDEVAVRCGEAELTWDAVAARYREGYEMAARA